MTVSSSFDHTVAIDIEGYLWSCGKNNHDQIHSNQNASILEKVPNLEQKFLAINCDRELTILIDDENHLWCCGFNDQGTLGFGHVTSVPLCINIFFTQLVIYVALNCSCVFVITKDGSLWVSGKDDMTKFDLSDVHFFSKIPLAEPVDILMNCSPRKIGARTKGAHR